MYESFFSFQTSPFPSVPRVDLYFPAKDVETAHQTLARCIDRAEGPGLLIGGTGCGKSLVCQLIAGRFSGRFQLVLLNSAQLSTRRALLQNILFELQLPYRGLEEGELRLSLLEHLKATKDSSEGMLLIVDETHTLPLRLVEEIRMITNLVSNGQPRVRLLLAGSPGFEERLGDPKLESLNQRIAARCYLQPLSYDETLGYVRAHLSAAGRDADSIFVGDSLLAVYETSTGVPRLINQICDHALMLAAVALHERVDAGMIEEAWADLQQLPMASTTSSAEPAENVIEFGSLDEPPARALVQEVAESSCIEIGELSERLDEIESQVRSLDEPDRTEMPQEDSTCSSMAVQDSELEVEPAPEPPDHCADDPFAETFASEEAVVDRYAKLAAESMATLPLNAELPAENKAAESANDAESLNAPDAACLIAPDVDPDEAVVESGDDTLTHSMPGDDAGAVLQISSATECDASDPDAEDRELIDSLLENVLLCADDSLQETGDAPEDSGGWKEDQDDTVITRVSVVRAVPTDDGDLIRVVDEDRDAVEGSRTSCSDSTSRDYRRLFSRLREDD